MGKKWIATRQMLTEAGTVFRGDPYPGEPTSSLISLGWVEEAPAGYRAPAASKVAKAPEPEPTTPKRPKKGAAK